MAANSPQYFVLTLAEINHERALLITMAGQEAEVIFQDHPSRYVAKDLGRWARRNLGLKGRTEPGVFTQIIWKGRVLGINQPLVTLLGSDQQEGSAKVDKCTFCQNPLRGPIWNDTQHQRGPFPYCYFCKDTPSWHHGWCCPQNVASSMYRGPTHADRTNFLTQT